MSGNPRENVKDQGFWDGGPGGQSTNNETAGRTSGTPGSRASKRSGYRTDLEFPAESEISAISESVVRTL